MTPLVAEHSVPVEVRYRIMAAASTLYAHGVQAMDALRAAPPDRLPGTQLLAVGVAQVQQAIRERTEECHELLIATPLVTLPVASALHTLQRGCRARGIRVTSVFCLESTEPAARDFLDAVDDMPHYSYCPAAVRIVDRRAVLIDGRMADGRYALLSLTSPRVLASAVHYWKLVSAAAVPIRSTPEGDTHETPLSARQLKIVRLLASDLDDEGIARAMQVSVRTVRYEIAAILRHFGVRSRFSAGFHLGRFRSETASAGILQLTARSG